MITKEQIEKNKKIFSKTNLTYNVYTPSLLEFLGDGLFTAPASVKTTMHNAFPGGLMDHTIKIAKYAAMFNEVLPEKIRYTKESIIKISFLCEIGKVFLFKPSSEKWKIEKGQPYEYGQDNTAMTVGERSIFYALSHGVILNEEEVEAILNYGKKDDKQAEFFTSPLGHILKTAINFAIIEEKQQEE